MKKMGIIKSTLLASALAFPYQAMAQDSGASVGAEEPDNSADIVVTALRRETSLQETAAVVTALSGAELASRGIDNVEDLAATVPAVSFGKNIGQASIAIRGIGSDGVVAGMDPRVGFYQDGVYISRPDAQVAGMFDVESVQVLKGPQGTLYGRNATGGAIVITSARPTFDMDGYVRLGYGNYNDVKVEMAAGGPVSDTVAVRFGGRYNRHGGYGRNVVTGTKIDTKDEIGLRGSLLWKPTPELEFLTIADYTNEQDRANGLKYFGQPEPGTTPRGVKRGGFTLRDYRDIASDIDPEVSIRTYGVVEHITYDAGWAKFKSITGYREVHAANTVDIDGTSAPLAIDILTTNAKQFNQELTVDGKAGRLSWLVGGQFLYEDIGPVGGEIPLSQAINGGPFVLTDGFHTLGYQKTNSLGFYGQLSYEVVDGLTITAGGRYSTEKKKLDDNFQLDFSRPWTPGFADFTPNTAAGFPRHLEARFSRFTPTGTIEYKVNRDIFLYATYSQGFKSGGFAIGAPQAPFKPEKITSYEGGIKTTLADGMITANLVGFHYDYKDLQVTQVRGNVSATENAASAKVDGIEAEFAVRPVTGLTLGANYAYVDARYGEFFTVEPSNPVIANCVAGGFGTVNASGQCVQDLSGFTLSQAPKHSLVAYGSYTIALNDFDLTFRADYNFRSKQYFTAFENDLVSQKRYGVANASIRLEQKDGWFIEGYMRNIANTKAISQVYVSSFGLFDAPVLGTSIAPRTYGVNLGVSF